MSPARVGMAFCVAVGLWLTAVCGALAQSEPTFPALTGRVVDQADLLRPDVEARLNQKLAALEAESSDQLVVVTVPDLQGYEIEDYGYRLGRHWGIGQREGDNGVLLIVAPNDRKVRIEVGYGLEGILTDALSSLIIQQQILPRFRTSDFEGGIEAGVNALDAQLRLDPAEAQVRAAEAAQQGDDRSGVAIPGLFILMIFAMLFFAVIGSAGRGRRRRGGSDATGVLIWAASEALRSSGRGGGGGFGGGGGGGFRGGGGSFGGGGASGGW